MYQAAVQVHPDMLRRSESIGSHSCLTSFYLDVLQDFLAIVLNTQPRLLVVNRAAVSLEDRDFATEWLASRQGCTKALIQAGSPQPMRRASSSRAETRTPLVPAAISMHGLLPGRSISHICGEAQLSEALGCL